jgi:malonyl-CoA O-methyltransferase
MPLSPGESDIAPALIAPVRVPMRWQTVRRQFDRRAKSLALHGFLLEEVARRLADRLDYIKLTPARILDVGCGAGRAEALLSKRFPAAQWTGVDLSLPMLRSGITNSRGLASWLDRLRNRTGRRICAEATQLPFAEATFDLLFSNLMLHWHPQPHSVFPEWKRVLAVDGLLLFSCFGPDTLQELRAGCAEALGESYPMPFIDMHDFGDMMVAAGFATPVMDVETIRLTYASARELLAEARALGGNPRDDRRRAIISGARARGLLAALERRRDTTGRIALTFEVAYGHAWKPAPKSPPESVISLDRLRAGLAARRR